MCETLKFPDGTMGIICGLRRSRKFCPCGRAAHLLCDWKMKDKKSGTCDAPVCDQHAQQVGPDKHLCVLHQKAYADWLKRHPGAILPPDYQQLSLLP
jgi:hypothetical protein